MLRSGGPVSQATGLSGSLIAPRLTSRRLVPRSLKMGPVRQSEMGVTGSKLPRQLDSYQDGRAQRGVTGDSGESRRDQDSHRKKGWLGGAKNLS